MTIAVVRQGEITFQEMEKLDVRAIDQLLLYKGEPILLEGPDGLGPFVAFERTMAGNLWDQSVLIPRVFYREPEKWLAGPLVVAAYREDGSLRGLTETEQRQLQIWRAGPGYAYPLLMVADPE